MVTMIHGQERCSCPCIPFLSFTQTDSFLLCGFWRKYNVGIRDRRRKAVLLRLTTLFQKRKDRSKPVFPFPVFPCLRQTTLPVGAASFFFRAHVRLRLRSAPRPLPRDRGCGGCRRWHGRVCRPRAASWQADRRRSARPSDRTPPRSRSSLRTALLPA